MEKYNKGGERLGIVSLAWKLIRVVFALTFGPIFALAATHYILIVFYYGVCIAVNLAIRFALFLVSYSENLGSAVELWKKLANIQ